MPATTIEQIREQVANDIRLSESALGIRIGTPFIYDDGDHCGFYLQQGKGGGWFLTDLGDVAMRAGYDDINLLSSGYRSQFENTLTFFGISPQNGRLIMPIENDRFGDSIFTFAQAALEVVKMAQIPHEQKKQKEKTFKQEVGALVTRIVPALNLAPNWHDEESDPKNDYPVDFRVAGRTIDWYIFTVGTAYRCLRAAVSCQRYRLLKRQFKGVAIYRNKSELLGHATRPLDDAADLTFSNITDSAPIEQFLTDKVLATI